MSSCHRYSFFLPAFLLPTSDQPFFVTHACVNDLAFLLFLPIPSSGGLSVIKASITNILEDEISELSLRKASEIKSLRFQQQGDHYLTGQENGEHENAERFLELDFRGFEIKTVKLELRRK